MLKEVFGKLVKLDNIESLNPYFNGTCSKSMNYKKINFEIVTRVLILILMEHAQRVH